MRFHGLMMLRDEEDVITQCLEHLLGWIDGLYIMDLGSTDSTWEIVQDFARRDRRIVPFLHEPIIYDDNLRGLIFDQFRSRFSGGDWVVKTDADEFYHVPPPQFVKEWLRAGETAVNLQWYYFRLTSAEVADYESGRIDVMADRKRPIEQRRRFYQIAQYTEPRMFRYRRRMRWSELASFPYNAGFVARERIPIRHYPHRDPVQMIRRYQLRSAMKKLKTRVGHWGVEDWHKDVFDPAAAIAAAGQSEKQGVRQMSGLEIDRVLEWKFGEPLPEVHLTNHLPRWTARLAQRIVHPLMLPVLDRTRPLYSKGHRPAPIPAEIQAMTSVTATGPVDGVRQ